MVIRTHMIPNGTVVDVRVSFLMVALPRYPRTWANRVSCTPVPCRGRMTDKRRSSATSGAVAFKPTIWHPRPTGAVHGRASKARSQQVPTHAASPGQSPAPAPPPRDASYLAERTPNRNTPTLELSPPYLRPNVNFMGVVYQSLL